MRCPHCGGLVILNTLTGEYVCTNCGTVLDVLYMPSRSMYENEPLSKTDLDLSEARDSDGNPSKELPLLKRLEKLNRIVSRHGDRELSFIRHLCQIGSRLGLDDTQLRFAIRAYKYILGRLRKTSIVKGTSITNYKVIAAAILYTILRFNMPVSVKDIVQVFRELGHRISVTDVIEVLRVVFGRFTYDVKERVLSYVSHIASRCGLDESQKVRVLRLSATLLSKIECSRIRGKNPRTLAAALFAYSMMRLGLKVSILDIASELDVSPLTLREHVRRLQKIVEQAECYDVVKG